MWRAIYPDDEGLIYIDGMTGKKAKKKLQYALDYMELHKRELEELNPPNGFGSYEGLKKLLIKLIAACIEHPKLTWSSWR